MKKEIVMGIDLGIKRSITTSAFYGFGDETMYNAVTEHWDEANSARNIYWRYFLLRSTN